MASGGVGISVWRSAFGVRRMGDAARRRPVGYGVIVAWQFIARNDPRNGPVPLGTVWFGSV